MLVKFLMTGAVAADFVSGMGVQPLCIVAAQVGIWNDMDASSEGW